VVFTGKMSYHANVTAALYLIRTIMPLVWAQRPQARAWIVGRDPPGSILRESAVNDRVCVTGAVPDVRPYLRRAMVAAAPVRYGAGIQNKVLEAMACGTPVVASPRGVSALAVEDGRHVLVAETPEAFARAILSVLTNRPGCQHLPRQARRYVEVNHDWQEITERLESIYAEVVANRVAP
jgi:glycosyltransferase involved in cell wall biosynthesis